MLELIKTETHSIVLYGFKDKGEEYRFRIIPRVEEILFRGSKEELLNMPEEWYDSILDNLSNHIKFKSDFKLYKNYKDGTCLDNAYQSIESATSAEPGEHYLIVKIKN